MKWAISTLRIPTIVLFISLLGGQSPFLVDSTLTSTIPQSISNSIQVGDLNNDRYNHIIFKGKPVATIVNGKFKMKEDKLIGEPEGKPLEFN